MDTWEENNRSRVRQREKLNCLVVATEASANQNEFWRWDGPVMGQGR